MHGNVRISLGEPFITGQNLDATRADTRGAGCRVCSPGVFFIRQLASIKLPGFGDGDRGFGAGPPLCPV